MLDKIRSKCIGSLNFKSFELRKIGLFAHSISQDVNCAIFRDFVKQFFSLLLAKSKNNYQVVSQEVTFLLLAATFNSMYLDFKFISNKSGIHNLFLKKKKELLTIFSSDF